MHYAHKHIRRFMSIELCIHAILPRRLERFIVLHILATSSLFSEILTINKNKHRKGLRSVSLTVRSTQNAKRPPRNPTSIFFIEQNANILLIFPYFVVFLNDCQMLSNFHSIVSTHAQHNIVFQSNCSRPTHSLFYVRYFYWKQIYLFIAGPHVFCLLCFDENAVRQAHRISKTRIMHRKIYVLHRNEKRQETEKRKWKGQIVRVVPISSIERISSKNISIIWPPTHLNATYIFRCALFKLNKKK